MEQPHPLSLFAIFVKLVILILTRFALIANGVPIVGGWQRNIMETLEDQVRALVEQFIMNLDARIVYIENEDGADWWTVEVEVARKDYDAARGMWYPTQIPPFISVQFRQKVPKLIGANVGDLVLVYDKHCGNEEDSSIGLVSSRFVNEGGEVYYGCQHLQISLNNRWVNGHYDFELTQENYAGYPEGFLKVLNKNEAILHMKRLLDKALDAELKKATSTHERISKNLDPFLTSLTSLKKIQSEKIDIDSLETPFYLSIKK